MRTHAALWRGDLTVGPRRRPLAFCCASLLGDCACRLYCSAPLIGHPFWTFEGADFHYQLTTALEHLAIIGGLIAIAAAGSGRLGPSPRRMSDDYRSRPA